MQGWYSGWFGPAAATAPTCRPATQGSSPAAVPRPVRPTPPVCPFARLRSPPAGRSMVWVGPPQTADQGGRARNPRKGWGRARRRVHPGLHPGVWCCVSWPLGRGSAVTPSSPLPVLAPPFALLGVPCALPSCCKAATLKDSVWTLPTPPAMGQGDCASSCVACPPVPPGRGWYLAFSAT